MKYENIVINVIDLYGAIKNIYQVQVTIAICYNILFIMLKVSLFCVKYYTATHCTYNIDLTYTKHFQTQISVNSYLLKESGNGQGCS